MGSFSIENLSNKPIVYVSHPIALSQTSSFDYFVSIINHLAEDVQSELNKDLIVKIPSSKGMIEDEQLKILDKVLSEVDKYSAIIISPASSKDLKNHFESQIEIMQEIFEKIPVYTIDKKIDELENGFQIPFVTGNWKQGGRLAGRACKVWLNSKRKEDRYNRVLIVRGKEGSEERIDGFTSYLKGSKVTIVETQELIAYSREAAYDHLDEFKSNYEINEFDLIFCCNDEMALGVREFLINNKISPEKTKIVGFDKTIEFAWLANHQSNHLLKSVDVQLRNQIRILTTYLLKYNYTAYLKNPKEFCHIEPARI